MYIDSKYLVLIALLLLIGNLILIIYETFFRRRSVFRPEGFVMYLTVLVVAEFTGISVFLVGNTGNRITQAETAWAVLAACIGITVMLLWHVSLMVRSDAALRQAIAAIIGIVEAGAPNLNGHALHVRKLALLIYENLPLDRKIFVNPSELEAAALLLDIGQFGAPRSITEKWGKLSPEEKALMRESSDTAADILKRVEGFGHISEWIRCNYERVDGEGRMGLSGKEIPFEARILAVAGTYSAITLTRTYKASQSYGEAIEELHIVAGKQLDREIVDIFCKIPIEEINACMSEVESELKYIRRFGE